MVEGLAVANRWWGDSRRCDAVGLKVGGMREPRFLRPRRYPIWNAATLTVAGVLIAGATASAVLLSNTRPLVIELEITLAILAAGLFAFLVSGLYYGIRLRRERFAAPVMPDRGDFSDWLVHVDAGGVDVSGIDIGGDDFGLGCLISILVLIVSLLAAVLLLALLYTLLPVAWALVILVALAVWWVVYLALRRVFVLSKWCRGDLARSVGYALGYTLLYTGWLFALLGVWHYVAGP